MKRPFLTLMAAGCCMAMATLAASAVDIDPDTVYNGMDYNGQELTATAADLGAGGIKFSNASATFWTAAPTFSAVPTQGFRGSNFTGANWSGATFTTAFDASGQFVGADFTNADFSGATFSNTGTANNRNDIFGTATFNNTNFSGATFTTSATETYNIFRGALFTGACDFTGAMILPGPTARNNKNLTTFAGSNFEGATISMDIESINLDGVSFQDATFLVGTRIRNSHANDVNFQGADLTGQGFANWLESLTWDAGQAPTYDDNTNFVTQNGTFDPAAWGWTYVGEPAVLTGDANNDGVVSADDFAAVQTNFGNTGAADGLLPGDANDDGVVSADDFAAIQTNFGNVLGAAAEAAPVPEPATMALLAITGLAATFRGRARRRA